MCKWRESSRNKPPSTVLLQGAENRQDKCSLPPLSESSGHHRSLLQQPDQQTSQQQNQTIRRLPLQSVQGNDDYSDDWHFGTAPWNRYENQVQGKQ